MRKDWKVYAVRLGVFNTGNMGVVSIGGGGRLFLVSSVFHRFWIRFYSGGEVLSTRVLMNLS